MSVFEMRNGVVAVSDPTIAAALLSRSAYWGNDEKSRIDGPSPQHQYKPGNFNGVERYRNKATRMIRVLFLIGGDPIDLKHRRWLFHNGCLYVHGRDMRDNRQMLMAKIADARTDKSDPERTLSVNEHPITDRHSLERNEPDEREKTNKTVG